MKQYTIMIDGEGKHVFTADDDYSENEGKLVFTKDGKTVAEFEKGCVKGLVTEDCTPGTPSEPQFAKGHDYDPYSEESINR